MVSHGSSFSLPSWTVSSESYLRRVLTAEAVIEKLEAAGGARRMRSMRDFLDHS